MTEALWGRAVRCPAIGACVARTQALCSSTRFEDVGVRDASVAYAPLTYIVKLLIPLAIDKMRRGGICVNQ